MVLQATLPHGVLRLPGITPETQATVRRLLGEDVKTHHCFYQRGFHNHLPHHLLAIYDLGASSNLMQAAYDKQSAELRPIMMEGSDTVPKLTRENWTTQLGNEQAYNAYVEFFSSEVAQHGAAKTFDEFVLKPSANGNGALMLVRLVAGAFHPLIQVGYGIEFADDRLVASGLAQTAVHNVREPAMYDDIFNEPPPAKPKGATDGGPTFLGMLKQYYDSPIMAPVMPYDPDALIGKRFTDAFASGERGQEIARLSRLWQLPADAPPEFWDAKVNELLWAATLLLGGTGRAGRKPRLDFFIMHMVTSALFVPSLFARAVPRSADRAALLQAYTRVALMVLTIRGRPRIDGHLAMLPTATPAPPGKKAEGNPWPAIIASAACFPEAHTPKTIRTLAFAAQRLGATPAGGVPGAIENGKEVLPGLAQVDGSLFIRTAGVVMDSLGWVDYGQEPKEWDRRALGWDDAWKNDD